MKIEYSKKTLRFNLIFGILWLVFFIIDFVFIKNSSWSNYFYLFISISYFINYFYMKKNGYITIKNGFIKTNNIFRKKIKLSDIKKFAGSYIVKTNKKKLTINCQILNNYSLIDLNKELNKINL